ncbi:metabotropic glutamate receptor 2-like [Tachypleus tridentatus]|uniref:metabotropic glutamate receptor 2-like n=1 Tax=Tachypleus tridentatus TaxID=6853 RepID=UPI003FD392CE
MLILKFSPKPRNMARITETFLSPTLCRFSTLQVSNLSTISLAFFVSHLLSMSLYQYSDASYRQRINIRHLPKISELAYLLSQNFSDAEAIFQHLNSENGDSWRARSLYSRSVLGWTWNKRNTSLNYTWPVKRVAEIEGDIILGGLMMVHEREDTQICGPIMPQGGIQALECMLYTIDWVNSQENFLPGITLGAYILDDCDKDTYGLEQAVDFIKGSIRNIDDGTYRCPDGSSPVIRQKIISGVLGAASSVTSIQVANLLRLFKIPQVSFFSTSPELSNKQRYEYFLRTVPSDTNQAQAMVEIIKILNWTYVSILYEESTYGIKAFNVLEEQLAHHNICIAIKEKLTKDSGVASEGVYDKIVRKLLSRQRARGVIIFGSDQEVAEVMRAVKRNNVTGYFSWIGSDGWSARALVFDGNEPQVEGTLSVQPRAHPVKGFDDYFLSLNVKNNRRNPWFVEYWEQYFHCKWPNSTVTPYNQNYNRQCSGDEVMTYTNGYESERQLQFVSDAVLSFAYAFRDMHQNLCGGRPGLCQRMNPIDGTELLTYLYKVHFTGLSGDEFQFSKKGDGPARYNIIHFKQVKQSNYQWVRVGEYKNGQLTLNLSQVQFRLHEPHMPPSVCSDPCEKGQAKKFVEGENCCWHCLSCTKYQVLLSETQCVGCPLGYLPDNNHERCIAIPELYMRPDNSWAIGALAFSTTGISVTVFVIVVFIRYNNTPVVKASGRELSYVLLAGILMCYGMTYVLVQRPTNFICGAQKTGIGLCFSVVYSALLTKTNRIARIFNAGKRSARRPSFISPKSQLVICGALVSVQISITVVWLAFTPPRAIHHYPSREDNHVVCAASINASYMVAFAYPITLTLICTVYAILTRKIPEAFNESKYIGFTMYTTCIIWLAFVPIYFSTAEHVALNVTTMSVAISLSSTVTLVCLFTPKLYILLLHPEKNIRQSMMPRNKHGTLNNTLITSSSVTRIESATQSEEYEMSEKLRISRATQTPSVLPAEYQFNQADRDVHL